MIQKNKISLIVFTLSLISLVCLPALSLAAIIPNSETDLNKTVNTANYVDNTVLVIFKKSGAGVLDVAKVSDDYINKANQNMVLSSLVGTNKQLDDFASKHKLIVKSKLNNLNTVLFSFDAKTRSVNTVLAEMRNDSLIEEVQPNYIYKLFYQDTGDADYERTYAIDNSGEFIKDKNGQLQVSANDADMDVYEAWGISGNSKGQGVVVGVLDTGLAYEHLEFANNLWDGSRCKNANGNDVPGGCLYGAAHYFNDNGSFVFANNPIATRDNMYYFKNKDLYTKSHGTHVAGIIAAGKGNGHGATGVAPEALVAGLQTDLTTVSIAWNISFAIQNNIKIINASFGTYDKDSTMRNAIAAYGQAGGLFVAAAGNDNNDNDLMPTYPCSYGLANILCVGASDWNDTIASYSNYGKKTVDVFAPGSEIFSTLMANFQDNGLGEGYAYMSGTSMATPNVAGVAALVWGQVPKLTALEVKKIIMDMVDKPNTIQKNKVVTDGRVNAEKALIEAKRYSELCADQDGDDPYVKSYTADKNGNKIEDVCTTNEFGDIVLKEAVCNINDVFSKNYRCYNGCENGACKSDADCDWQVLGRPDFSDGIVGYISLAIEPETNIPYVVYEDMNNGGKAVVKKYDEGTKIWEIVGVNKVSEGEAWNTSIVFDKTTSPYTPYVVYEDRYNNKKPDTNVNVTVMKLNYLTQTWEPVGNKAFPGKSSWSDDIGYDSLAVNEGIPYAAYGEYRFGSSWGNTAVLKPDSNGNWVAVGNKKFISNNECYYQNIVFDNNSKPSLYVACSEFKGPVLVYKLVGSTWVNISYNGISADWGKNSNLVFDKYNVPYIAYSDDDNAGKSFIKKLVGNSWSLIGNNNGIDGGVSYLAFNNDMLNAAYSGSNNKANVVKVIGNNLVSVGDKNFSKGTAYGMSLAFGINSQPYVSFSDGANNNGATVMTCAPRLALAKPLNKNFVRKPIINKVLGKKIKVKK